MRINPGLVIGWLITIQLELVALGESNTTSITRSCDCPVFAGEELTVRLSVEIAGSSEYKANVLSNGVLCLPLEQSLAVSNQTEAQVAEQIGNVFAKVLQIELPLSVAVTPAKPYFLMAGGRIAGNANTNKVFYTGQMTLLRAVDTAGGFTDFSVRWRYLLVRSNGERITVDWKKAIRNPALDPIVCPGDRVVEMKRLPFGTF